MLLGANLQRLAEFFDLHEKIGMTVATICEAFKSLEADVSDDVSHFSLETQCQLDLKLSEK